MSRWATRRRTSRGKYQITRAEVDAYAARSFERAVKAEAGFFAGEIAPVKTEEISPRGLRAAPVSSAGARHQGVDHDTHIRPSSVEALAKLRPAFGGVQTGGNPRRSSMARRRRRRSSSGYVLSGGKPLGALVAGAAVGVPPEIMGIGPVPAIQAVLERAA